MLFDLDLKFELFQIFLISSSLQVLLPFLKALVLFLFFIVLNNEEENEKIRIKISEVLHFLNWKKTKSNLSKVKNFLQRWEDKEFKKEKRFRNDMVKK